MTADWKTLGYDWREIRLDDLDGEVVGMRVLGTEEVEVVCPARELKACWGRKDMPPWIWDSLFEKREGFILGRVVGGGRKVVKVYGEDKDALISYLKSGDGTPDGNGASSMVMEVAEDGGVRIGSGASGADRARMVGEYVRRGWAIFPLAPGSKATHRGSKGYRDARVGGTAEIAFEDYYNVWHRDNVGLACGMVGSPVVLDIDPKNGGSLERAIEHFGMYSKDRVGLERIMRETARVNTPSGGMHLYFEDEELSKPGSYLMAPSVDSGRFAGLDGVEFKASGKHVVMPPSSLSGGGEYVWESEEADLLPLPDAIRDACFEARASKSDLFPGADEHAFWIDPDLLVSSVEETGSGGRNTVLHAATREAARCLGGAERKACMSRLKDAGIAAGLGEAEVKRTMRSALEYVLGPGYVL